MNHQNKSDKLRLISLVEKLGNVSEACRITGYSRDSYYRIKKIYDQYGIEGLHNKSKQVPLLKNRLNNKIEATVLSYSLKNPLMSSRTLSQELLKKKVTVSTNGIRNIWIRNDLETIQKRLEHLQLKIIIFGYRPTKKQIDAFTKKWFHYNHQSSDNVRYPGQILIFSLKHVCTSKVLGTLYQVSLVDRYSEFVVGSLINGKGINQICTGIEALLDSITLLKIPAVTIILETSIKKVLPEQFINKKLKLNTHFNTNAPMLKHSIVTSFHKQNSDFYTATFKNKTITTSKQLSKALSTWINEYNNRKTRLSNATYSLSPKQIFTSSPTRTNLKSKKIVTSETVFKNVSEGFAPIDTYTDPHYEIEYTHSKFIPPHGKTLFILGHEKCAIEDYLKHFDHVPAGFMSYTSIQVSEGLSSDCKNDLGTQNAQHFMETYPNTVLANALWIVGEYNLPTDVINGKFDHIIDTYGCWAQSIQSPQYLRIGWEVNGAQNSFAPKEYIAAYRYIVKRLKKLTDSIAFIWHVCQTKNYNDCDLLEWYPGDQYVDWFGIGTIDNMYSSIPNHYMRHTLDLSILHKKPIMICWATASKGIPAKGAAAWNDWFVNFFSFIYRYNIKGFCYMNSDFENYPLYDFIKIKNASIQRNKQVSELWTQALQSKRYLHQSDDLYTQLGFKKQK